MLTSKQLFSLLGRHFPRGRDAYHGMRARLLRRMEPAAVFERAYRKNWWGSGESHSGAGSTLSETVRVREELPLLLRELQVKSILDIPCGDFNWMKAVDLGDVSYLGADIVAEVVEGNRCYERDNVRFLKMDLIMDPLPDVDLVMVRDCLVHFSFADCRRALQNIASARARYLLTTTYRGTRNEDIATGQWRALNLCKAPINLPKPRRLIKEGSPDSRFADKSLGLWLVSDVRSVIQESAESRSQKPRSEI